MTELEQPRITPEAALAAYQRTGKTSLQGAYLDGDCACGIGVMHVAAGKPYDLNCPYRNIRRDAVSIYGEGYVTGFMDGFDDYPPDDDYKFTDRERQGYEDGKAVWAAVQHLATL